MSMQAQAERERQARVILGDSERQVAEKFGEAAKTYANDPTAFHLRAMNMLYEGLKRDNATIVIVPSTAVESMQLGGSIASMSAMAGGNGQSGARDFATPTVGGAGPQGGPSAVEDFLDPGRHGFACRPIAAIVEEIGVLGPLEVDLAGLDAHRPRFEDEACRRIDGAGSADGDEQIGPPQRALDFVEIERQFAEPDDVRPHPAGAAAMGTDVGDVEVVEPMAKSLSQSSQRAFNSSPCICRTSCEPARSCRSSMFCVTSANRPPRFASATSSRASAKCAALGFAPRVSRRR